MAGIGGVTSVPRRKFAAKTAAAADDNGIDTEGAPLQHTADDIEAVSPPPAAGGGDGRGGDGRARRSIFACLGKEGREAEQRGPGHKENAINLFMLDLVYLVAVTTRSEPHSSGQQKRHIQVGQQGAGCSSCRDLKRHIMQYTMIIYVYTLS